MLRQIHDVTGSRRAWRPPAAPAGIVGDVAHASELLEIGEFELFELAYRQWYGRTAHPKAIERQFVGYMFGKEPPAWVRHFVREVLTLQQDGQLDPGAYGLSRAPAEETSSEAVRACNDIMLALWFAGAYAVWSFQGF
ncbi:MAG: hypothetical protein QNJ94_04070 [Alphaproteobacteria bacterium]|nr:hypothetical protein [Alphaproteobacteria bacterium]